MLVVALLPVQPAAADRVSRDSCSASGFELKESVFYRSVDSGRKWKITRLEYSISGDASRHSNNVWFGFYNNNGFQHAYSNDHVWSDGRKFGYIPFNWRMGKKGAKWEGSGQFDVPLAPDPQCFIGFNYL